MESWNANYINEIFIKRANERNPDRYFNKPKNEAFDKLMQVEIALHDVNWHCAQNCWQKTKLLQFLDSISPSIFINKPSAYVDSYINEAKVIKESILSVKLKNKFMKRRTNTYGAHPCAYDNRWENRPPTRQGRNATVKH